MTVESRTATPAADVGYARRTSTTTATNESAKPYRGKRLSWREFHKLMAEVANDNEPEVKSTAAQS